MRLRCSDTAWSRKKEPSPRSEGNKTPRGSRGASMSPRTSMKLSQISSFADVPPIVGDCIDYLNKHQAHLIEGIFRLSGNNQTIQDLVDLYETTALQKDIDKWCKSDLHAVAGALKKWLRDQDDCLLTFELYESFLAAVAVKEVSLQIGCLQKSVQMLPKVNMQTLDKIMSYLSLVASHEKTNKMSPENLATVFAPTLLRSRVEKDMLAMLNDADLGNRIIVMFIKHHQQIFKPDELDEKIDEMLKSNSELAVYALSLKKGTARLAQGFLKDALKNIDQEIQNSQGNSNSPPELSSSPDSKASLKSPVWNVFDTKQSSSPPPLSSLKPAVKPLNLTSLSIPSVQMPAAQLDTSLENLRTQLENTELNFSTDAPSLLFQDRIEEHPNKSASNLEMVFTVDHLVRMLISGESEAVQSYLQSLPLQESQRVATEMQQKLQSQY